MRILIIEPFMGGSHASWALGLQKHSAHDVEILSLPGRHWKWRMHGGAVTLSKKFIAAGERFDLIIATDMLDLAVFLGLSRNEINNTPVVVYFHENQLSYPWSPQDEDVRKGRDFHYGFINWTTVLSADAVWFNSRYNMESFYKGVGLMLKAMPDSRHMESIDLVRKKSSVLPLGIDLEDLHNPLTDKDLTVPVILWNHRWEYDKDPETFFTILSNMKDAGVNFRLIVCGEAYERYPRVFDTVQTAFKEELLHFGYAESRDHYLSLLKQANLLPVTNSQEFFGQSVMEAVAAGCFPIFPDALAYPEHIPGSLEKMILYKSVKELEEKLTDACRNIGQLAPITETMQQVAIKFDWRNIIGQYDEWMAQVADAL